MASTTANLQKLKQASTELENISVAMVTNHSKLTEVMQQLSSKWHGEAAGRYLDEFYSHSPDLEKMAAVIDSASRSLDTVGNIYAKAEDEASGTIRAMLGKG